MIKLSHFLGETEHGSSVIPLFGPADAVFEKTASSHLLPEVVRYIEALRPRDDAQYVLVNAMGASEWWGQNVNGDIFYQDALLHVPEGWSGNPLLDQIKAKDWPYGYPTFYGAKPFAHHRNKDAARGFGDVELATWNDPMKRVELVVRVDKDKCDRFGGTGVWDKLRAGQFPDVSMGTRVPYDLCTICTDWKLYREAEALFNPKKYKHAGESILAFHRTTQKHVQRPNDKGEMVWVWEGPGRIRGLSVTRADYCFPPGTPLLLADGSFKNVEEVAVGDQVLTHMGVARPVSRLLPSTGAATLVSIEAWGFLPVEATDNHPFWSVRPTPKVARVARLAGLDWVAAGDLSVGDVVVCPLPTITNDSAVPPAYGFLLGLYLAEGSVCFSSGSAHPKATRFTVHASERSLLEEAVSAARGLDDELTEKYYEYKDRNALDLRVNSCDVSAWLLHHGGRGSRTKSLSSAVWHMGKEFCHQVLRGWAAGDGSYDAERKVLRVATSSVELARQMQLMAAACGVVGGLSRHDRTTNFGDQTIWYLSFSGDAADAIREGREQKEFAQQSKLFLCAGYLCTTVRKLSYKDYVGPLHNFEVEEDHSYVAGSYAVHNCEHARKQMNKILPDGRKVGVINTHPRFFDISFVFIGADKTAKTMMKIAGIGQGAFWDIGGSAELAEKLGYADLEKVAFELQGHTEVQGLEIDIENRKGSVRKGVDKDGHEWRTKMKFPYGYIKGTKGKDGEEVDVYVGPNKESPWAFVVHQHKDNGKGFDEDKVMLGFSTEEEARKAYLAHYDDPKFLGPISKVSVEDLKAAVDGKKPLPKITPEALAKAASVEEELKLAFLGKNAKDKEGEITKDVVPSQFAGKAVPVLTEREKDLPKELLDLLGSRPLEESLSTTGGLGIVLRPREFQRIVLIRIGRRDLADDYEDKGITFSKSDKREPLGLNSSSFSPALARLLLPLLSSRSMLGPAVEKRVVILSGMPKEARAKTSSLSSDLLDKLAAVYSSYRNELMDFVPNAPVLLASTRSDEACKLASAGVDELFTPLSAAYVKNAFYDEIGSSLGVERGLPSGNTAKTI